MTPPARLIHQILDGPAKSHPHGMAVEAAEGSLSYAALHDAAGRFAAALAAAGVGAGDRVAMGLKKTPQAIVSIFGCLRSGAVFVPLDPGAPPARLASIVSDCAPRALIATRARALEILRALPPAGRPGVVVLADGGPAPSSGDEAFEGIRAIGWEEAMAAAAAPTPSRRSTDLAYILYTSGSTGTPKGVMISHENALAFTSWAARRFGVQPGDRVTSVAPFHFDLSTFDIYSTLEGGATILLVPRQVSLFPASLAAFLESRRATMTYLVPSTLTGLLLRGDLASRTLTALRTILFAGEVLPARHLSLLLETLPRVELFNLYGPTETNVCTFYQVRPRDAHRESPLPIGTEASGDVAFALDDEGRRIGTPGREGELLVAGPTVALGYWRDPVKTARSFLDGHPEAPPGWRVYRTGDRVSLDAEGSWLFHGRRDHMIKSRGYRIELGDIEAALYAHAAVAEAAAVPVPDEEIGNRIRAFLSVKPEGPAPAPAELLRHCAERLPRYMVPESVELLPALPKTSSGKIDRARLASLPAVTRTG